MRTVAALPVKADPVARARALGPALEAAADEIERTQEIPEPLLSQLHEARLFRMLLPRSVCGDQVEPWVYMRAIEEIARFDGSVGWNAFVANSSALIAPYIPIDAARTIYSDPRGLIAWGPPNQHRAIAAPGGYRVTGEWHFASGSRQASWLGAHVKVVEADGTTRKKSDGAPEIRTILFPMSAATMYDVWDVIGLKGTGTDSYSVENLFIPEKFAALRDDISAVREKGPLYKLTTNAVFSMGFAATSLGVARATLDAATDLARKKIPQGLGAMRENNAVQGQIGRTEALLRAARAYLYSTAAEVWRDLERGDVVTEAHRIAMRIAATWTIHQSASVVDTAYHMSGATAVFAANPFERRFRDMHAIAQQIQARDTHYEDAGKAILMQNLQKAPTSR